MKLATITKIIFLTLPALLVSSALAQTPNINPESTQKIETAPAAAVPKWSGTLTAGRSNSLYVYDGESSYAAWDYLATLNYELSDKYTLSALVEGAEDIKDANKSDFSKGYLILSRKAIDLAGKKWAFAPSTFVAFPVSRAANSASTRGSLTGVLKLILGDELLPSKKFSLSTSVSLTRSFHEYETGVSGSVNNPYSSTQNLTVGWSFTDKLAVSAQVNHFNRINYQGRLSEMFNHAQEIGYSLTDRLAFALGHQYGNPEVSVRRPDGQEWNLTATDEDNSIVYGTATVSF